VVVAVARQYSEYSPGVDTRTCKGGKIMALGILAFMLGVLFGWAMCAIMTMAKIADGEEEL
jgi:hypothetical protein